MFLTNIIPVIQLGNAGSNKRIKRTCLKKMGVWMGSDKLEKKQRERAFME
jgi:hypothetical protein